MAEDTIFRVLNARARATQVAQKRPFSKELENPFKYGQRSKVMETIAYWPSPMNLSKLIRIIPGNETDSAEIGVTQYFDYIYVHDTDEYVLIPTYLPGLKKDGTQQPLLLTVNYVNSNLAVRYKRRYLFKTGLQNILPDTSYIFRLESGEEFSLFSH